MDKLAIKSEVLILKNRNVLSENGGLIRRRVAEGEDSEEVCKEKTS